MTDRGLLLDLSQRLADLPERLADVLRRRDRGRTDAGPQQGQADVQTSAPGAGASGRSLEGPRDRYGATVRLLSAGGAFLPGLGEIAQTMRNVKELQNALAAFVRAWQPDSSSPAMWIPKPRPSRKLVPRPARAASPLEPYRPIRLDPRPVAWADEDDMLRARRRALPPPRAIDPSGRPFVPTRSLPAPARPLLPGPKAKSKRRPRPIPPPARPSTVPPKWMRMHPPKKDRRPNWARPPMHAGPVSLDDPRAYELDLKTGNPVLPGRLPPLTSAQGGPGGQGAPAADRDTQHKLDKLVELGGQIVQVLQEQQADEDGGTPSAAEREQGGRRSMWDSSDEGGQTASTPATRPPLAMPGRPARMPGALKRQLGRALAAVLEGLL